MRVLGVVFLLFFSVFFSCTNHENEEKKDLIVDDAENSESVPSRQSIPIQGLLDESILKEYFTRNLALGFLNNDTIIDRAFIVREEDEGDEKLLLVLFGNQDGTFNVSLNTSDFISLTGYNEVDIVDKKLFISSGDSWQGSNMTRYEFEFANNEWVCNHANFSHGDHVNSWSTNADFIKGEFLISHLVRLVGDIKKTKEVKGSLPINHPAILSKNEIEKCIKVKNENTFYNLFAKNDLWTEEEILDLLPENYQLIIGLWKSKISEDMSVSFDANGGYNFNGDINEEYQELEGKFKLKNDSVLFEYPSDMRSTIFRIATLDQEVVLINNKNIKFYKEKENRSLIDTAQ